MVSQFWLQWAFTVCFAVFGVDSIARLATGPGVLARVRHGWHGVMSVAMILMSWPRLSTLAPLTQSVVFALATLWFVAVVVLARRQGARLVDQAGHSAWEYAYHAVMMAAMAWMLLAMSPLVAGRDGAAAGGHQHHALPVWVGLVSVGALVLMLSGAAIYAVEGIRALSRHANGLRGHAVEFLVVAGMSLGMAGMFVPMVQT